MKKVFLFMAVMLLTLVTAATAQAYSQYPVHGVVNGHSYVRYPVMGTYPAGPAYVHSYGHGYRHGYGSGYGSGYGYGFPNYRGNYNHRKYHYAGNGFYAKYPAYWFGPSRHYGHPGHGLYGYGTFDYRQYARFNTLLYPGVYKWY